MVMEVAFYHFFQILVHGFLFVGVWVNSNIGLGALVEF
jgi:hypothetical protein